MRELKLYRGLFGCLSFLMLLGFIGLYMYFATHFQASLEIFILVLIPLALSLVFMLVFRSADTALKSILPRNELEFRFPITREYWWVMWISTNGHLNLTGAYSTWYEAYAQGNSLDNGALIFPSVYKSTSRGRQLVSDDIKTRLDYLRSKYEVDSWK